MSIDLEQLRQAVATHGTVRRIVVVEVRGSAPREAGAAMLVWDGGSAGTIGGGQLEFEAIQAARAGRLGIVTYPLGPALGQCCGGSVTLATEAFDAARLQEPAAKSVVRRVSGAHEIPAAIRRAAANHEAGRPVPEVLLEKGWLFEPVAADARPVWIWGAGHVGRAIAEIAAPLPGLSVTWLDTATDRFPAAMPTGVTRIAAPNLAGAVRRAPIDAEHLIVTRSHALDLEICHRLLGHGFAAAGLIGSRTKWARFRSRLSALGHAEAAIDRIRCPIGNPELGKHPRAIAVGVAAALLSREGISSATREKAG